MSGALHGWVLWCQTARLHHTVALRWRSLHLSASFAAWREFVQERQQQRDKETTVALRWKSLHLAAAFNAWWEHVQVSMGSCTCSECVLHTRHHLMTDQCSRNQRSCIGECSITKLGCTV